METIKGRDCQAGKWYQLYTGERMLCLGPSLGIKSCSFVRADYYVLNYAESDFTALPDCTGWDWQPLELKEGGYYELQDGTLVGPISKRKADGCWDAMPVGVSVGTGYWFNKDGSNVTPQWSIVREVPKPEPKYRAFKDAAELLKHTKFKQLKYKDTVYGVGLVDLRTFGGVDLCRLWHKDRGFTPWLSAQTMLEQCTFADTGEPCGVKL